MTNAIDAAVHREGTTNGTDAGADPRGISFFDGDSDTGLLEVMSMPTYEPGVLEQFGDRMGCLEPVFETRVLFHRPETDGASVVYFKAMPGAQLPAHTHDSDCSYMVLAGEARLGTRVVPARSGFFVPAGVRYGYQAGPEGVEVLEFRAVSRFAMHITEKSPSRWHSIFQSARTAAGAQSQQS